METLNEISEVFLANGVQSGGELYLPIRIASEFIQKCYDNSLAIIGIDFVHITNGKIVPTSPINSMDASYFLDKNQAWKDLILACKNFALEVINKELERDPKQYCTFVVATENEDH